MKSSKFRFLLLLIPIVLLFPITAGATAIVAAVDGQGNIYMGADTCVSYSLSGNKLPTDEKKIFISNNVIFGFAGVTSALYYLKNYFTPPARPAGLSSDAYIKKNFAESLRKFINKNHLSKYPFCLLVGYDGKLYQIRNDGIPYGINKKHYAIGSGAPFAIGSLDSTEGTHIFLRLKSALKTAAENNIMVAPPWQFRILKK